MTIGQRIKQIRKGKNLSQGKLAEMVGVDQSVISQLENDVATGTKHVASLANALRVNALWLEKGKGKPDLLHIEPNIIEKRYDQKTEEIIALMQGLDERGRQKVLNAAQDAAITHQAWLNSLPKAIDPESFALQQFIEAAPDLIDAENRVSDAHKNVKKVSVRKGKQH